MSLETFSGAELHMHVTGSIGAALVPWWIHWLREVNPDILVNVSITRSAGRFLSRLSLERLANGRVWLDSWDDASVPRDVHSGLSGGSECFILFPATLDTLMRLAQGRSDSPALLMFQVTSLPIVLADTLPGSNEIIESNLEALRNRRNIGFAPRVNGIRAGTRSTVELGFNLPGAIAVANTMMKEGRSRD